MWRGKKQLQNFELSNQNLFLRADSDSDLSLSGFETVASHSFDEEDEEDAEDRFLFSVPYGSPTGMLQEEQPLHGDAAQSNGITEHRSGLRPRWDENGVKPTKRPFCLFFLLPAVLTLRSSRGSPPVCKTLYWCSPPPRVFPLGSVNNSELCPA